jgi:phage terminase large subunit-like protein
VFASGRSAIEALACGCAVVVLGQAVCGEMVREDNFDRLREADFAAPSNTMRAESIRAEIGKYSAAACAAIAERIRHEAVFPPYVERLDRIYHAAIAAHEKSPDDFEAEQWAISEYLTKLSPMLKAMDQLQKTEGDAPIATASIWVDIAGKLAALQSAMDKPVWF